MSVTFTLSDEQYLRLASWYEDLPSAPVGAVAGRLTYQFTPTSLGDVVKVVDEVTKQQIDLTDYNLW